MLLFWLSAGFKCQSSGPRPPKTPHIPHCVKMMLKTPLMPLEHLEGHLVKGQSRTTVEIRRGGLDSQRRELL